MPIYKDGNSYSDRGGGDDITDQIDRLLPKKRGKGRLGPAPSREALPVSVAEVLPESTKPGGGISWPLTETSRVTETVRVYDPNDATRYVDVERVTELYLEDDEGNAASIILTPTT